MQKCVNQKFIFLHQLDIYLKDKIIRQFLDIFSIKAA